MGGLADLVQTRSISRFGLSQVTLVFEDWVDIYRARQMVSERLQGVVPELPEGIQPGLGPVTTGLGEVHFYTLQASTPAVGAARVAQLMELKSVQDWYVKPRLLTVPGVAEVNSIGGFEKQFHVNPTSAKWRNTASTSTTSSGPWRTQTATWAAVTSSRRVSSSSSSHRPP
ncbi:MAG: efflux RND transporter permease subunit [Elusimicrobia bacterium]|nr:efflux RND transporter permease subunit [Elusimicrobiota bacterium]